MLEAIGRKSEEGPRSRTLRQGTMAAAAVLVVGPVLTALGASTDVTLGVVLAVASTATVLIARGMQRTLRPRWR